MPPEVPPDQTPPEINDPVLPGEHSPIRDPVASATLPSAGATAGFVLKLLRTPGFDAGDAADAGDGGDACDPCHTCAAKLYASFDGALAAGG